ncbi:hypothetical protein SAMN00768000_2210 [Sulfobacillus thermosulfidooxidans DSM 9293]|uniref:Uncharacterized protein n=1 Tax=Sulfobacillus thermosulfidooxidans (strain DSM 9293 / VKM B-1269 / AT-1) TaxID=929705 RepID=A0A1W1WGS0_SULTA|nr:hypothetical protein [Sulfobacillus thermosulfidooxidans]SMC05379.1 hypothetical protein SAMN00768000_2210 [Sulfobacillus thermosulfidooxidans DSM 9293]
MKMRKSGLGHVKSSSRNMTSPLWWVILFIPLLANGVLAFIIMRRCSDLASGHDWIGWAALLFFGIIPLGAMLMVQDALSPVKRWWRRRNLRVVTPSRKNEPESFI